MEKKRKIPVKQHKRKVPKGSTTVKQHTRSITQKQLKDLQIKKLKLLDRVSHISDSMGILHSADIYEMEFPSSKALPSIQRAENLMELSSAYNITYKKKFEELEDHISESKEIEEGISETLEEISDLQMKDINKTTEEIKEVDKQIPRELVYRQRD